MKQVRIDKIFSNLGLLSRTECKKAINAGFIAVNGQVCISSEEKVNPDTDKITFKGQNIDSRSFVYYMLNKPSGVITATEDKFSKTVFDLIDDKRTDLAAVGRLDKDTTGILIITNDGQLNHRLLAPRYEVPKTYAALIDGQLNEQDISLLERGLDIGDEKPTLPAKVEILNNENPEKVRLTITEGRFHQVKRMLAKVGKPVLKLHRESFGPLFLDKNLKEGSYRELTEEELEKLLKITGSSRL